MKHYAFPRTYGELGNTRSPYRIFTLLVCDSIMNTFEGIETLTESEQKRIMQVVRVAATELLLLLAMPDDWSEFVNRLSQLRPLPQMACIATERMFELLPPTPRTWSDELIMLLEVVRDSAGDETKLRRASMDLELHFGLMTNQACEDAFALGFKAAQDASLFLFEDLAPTPEAMDHV
jgi:hypothetical protein